MGELIDKAKGRIKQAAGDLTGNKRLKAEGAADELKGKAKGVVEKAKAKVREAVKDVKKASKKQPKK